MKDNFIFNAFNASTPEKLYKNSLRFTASKVGVLLTLLYVSQLLFAQVALLVYYKLFSAPNQSVDSFFKAPLSDFATYSLNIVVATLAFLVVAVTALIFFKFNVFSQINAKDPTIVKVAVKGYPVIILANLVFSLISSFVITFFAVNDIVLPNADFTVVSPTAMTVVVKLGYGAVFAPLIEELMYRGIVLGMLKPYGNRMAIVVSSLVFGLMHGNIDQFIPAFAVGLVMGYTAVKCNSILPSILLHMANNLITSIIGLFTDTSQAYVLVIFQCYYIFTIVCALIGVYVLFANYKKIKVIDPPSPLSRRTTYLTVFLNVFVLIYLAIQVAEYVQTIAYANS